MFFRFLHLFEEPVDEHLEQSHTLTSLDPRYWTLSFLYAPFIRTLECPKIESAMDDTVDDGTTSSTNFPHARHRDQSTQLDIVFASLLVR